MEAKAKILDSIRNIALPSVALPDIPAFLAASDSEKLFTENLRANKAEICSPEEIEKLLKGYPPEQLYSDVPDFEQFDSINGKEEHREYADLEMVVLRADLGVAENGALWVTKFPHRIVPFITHHLVLVVDSESIVNNMHEAYEVIGPDRGGFGVFIAGPSKTADIEQNLVIGAHGPVSLKVLIR